MIVISHDQLDRGHSLSLTVQPEIATLINSLRSERNKFTFLVGAGASIDAGLPDWRSLLNNIANQVPKGLDGLLRADPDELMRKAEHGGLFTAFLKCALTRGFTGRHAVCE